MRILLHTLVLTACLALPLQARLGETLEECIKRYGEPVGKEDGDTFCVFRKGPLKITVFVAEGKVQAIVFEKPGEVFAEELSEEEISTLLESNAGGLKWETVRPDPGIFSKFWATPKKDRWASYETIQHRLHIMTNDGRKKIKAYQKKKEQDALKDF